MSTPTNTVRRSAFVSLYICAVFTFIAVLLTGAVILWEGAYPRDMHLTPSHWLKLIVFLLSIIAMWSAIGVYCLFSIVHSIKSKS